MREPAHLSRRTIAAVLPIAALAGATALVPAEAAGIHSPDPVLAQIEEHRALRDAIGRTSGRDNDPAYMTACDVEEAALQALGDAVPTSVAGAAALLRYMAEIEADFADPLSPLLRTVLTVARGLSNLSGSTSA